MSQVNLTPDPKILATIAQNPMKPIDALSELIDNSLDGFASAADAGSPISEPTVTIEIPSLTDIESGIGVLRIRDNGTGLTRDQAISAVTAGFSGQDNPIDRLGLFGMGFNISTAKLGQKTKFITYERKNKTAVSILIDIPSMMKSRSFDAPVEELDYDESLSGTTIEISDWWGRGHQNDGFVQSLAKTSKPKLREQIGRRYSALITKGYKIVVNGTECPEFQHCAWTEHRFVEHRTIGKIPARIYIDEDLGQEFRCKKCWTELSNADIHNCNNCNTVEPVRIVNKRIKGWVGIQRFDHASMYGIDLIRNGRVIRDSEKDAFFTFRTEDGEEIKDYPIDSQYGRIIGSIEINHVPVNYLKTDFDRTSNYWGEVIEFLRGTTSLQPERAQGQNNSVIYKLFQGYRKVRQAGVKELYMGTYNTQTNRSERISRLVENEYYEKFKQNVPGYGYDDDTEWYKRVVEADQVPTSGFKDCPKNHTNPEDAEICGICGYIFDSKQCINSECSKDIPKSALRCEHCGTEQIQGTDEFWQCNICKYTNPPDQTKCMECGEVIGATDPFERKSLLATSSLSDDLSIRHKSIELPDGTHMEISANVYLTRKDHSLKRAGQRVPSLTIHSKGEIEIFIDQTHPAYSQYQDRYEDYIAMELASYIVAEKNSQIANQDRPYWSVANMYFRIHDRIWQNRTRLEHAQLVNDINAFFSDLLERAPYILGIKRNEILDELNEADKQHILARAFEDGKDISSIMETDKFLMYLPPESIPRILRGYPELFFDNRYWNDTYSSLDSQLSEENKKNFRESVIVSYTSSMEDVITYKKLERAPLNPQITQRAANSLALLTQGVN